MYPRPYILRNKLQGFPIRIMGANIRFLLTVLLQIAQNHISALERLIEAYAMIGEAMPRFNKLSTAFKDDPEFLQVMGHFYQDILEFHRRAYQFFRKRGKQLVNRFPHALLKKFLPTIQPGKWSLIPYGKPSILVSKLSSKA